MLDVPGITELLSTGADLPQQKFRQIPQDEALLVQKEAERLLGAILLALPLGAEAMVAEEYAIRARLSELMDEHGWFETAMLLAFPLAPHTLGFDLEVLPEAEDEDAEILVCAYRVAAEMASDAPGIWTVPLAMLGSSSRETAHEFIMRMLCAAAYSILSRSE